MAKKNIHSADRLIRLVIAEALAFYGYYYLPSSLSLITYIVSFLMLIGSATGVSYIYTLFDLDSNNFFKGWLVNILKIILIYTAVILALLPLYHDGASLLARRELIIATIIGFTAQIIDGSLGMAYGITSNTFLLSMGIPPIASSASIHTAEILTSGAEGLAHLKAGNVDRHILKYLAISGAIGAFVGAYLLSNISSDFIKPFIAIYLFIMGVLIIEKAFEKKPLIIKAFCWVKHRLQMAHGEQWGYKLTPFGVIGGILDSIGGGGWGPLITLTLFFKGENLRQAIGSVTLTEFFVTAVASITLLTALKMEYWQIILGLMIGGLLAVPVGPYITKKLPYKPLMIFVGTLVTLLSLRTLYIFFF